MKTEIRNELKEIASSLVQIGNENCYRVPEGYFEGFADELMSKIHLPFTQLPYTAPASTYFEGLAGSILNKIKSSGIFVETDNEVAVELKALSPLLSSIKKVNVYTVPVTYFANFKVAIPATEEKAKVGTILRSPVRWMRYAAAAIIVGIITLSGILLFRNDSTDGKIHFTFTEDYSAPLSAISDDAIASYLKQSPAEMDIIPSTYDESKINAGSLAEQLLNDIPDSAIQEYLQENEEPGEKDIKGI